MGNMDLVTNRLVRPWPALCSFLSCLAVRLHRAGRDCEVFNGRPLSLMWSTPRSLPVHIAFITALNARKKSITRAKNSFLSLQIWEKKFLYAFR